MDPRTFLRIEGPAVLALVLGVVGFRADVGLATLVALVWAGHIGADRLVGYGLKFDSGFTDTHLSAQPPPVAALAESNRRDPEDGVS